MEDWLGFCRYCDAPITAEDLSTVRAFDICADCHTVKLTLIVLAILGVVAVTIFILGIVGMRLFKVQSIILVLGLTFELVGYCMFATVILMFYLGLDRLANFI